MSEKLHIVGGGLAGSEAAWQAAEAGARVVLHEMRPVRGTEAHVGDGLAELVCSNSFRSDDWENNAVGLLHEEMRRAGSLIMRTADAHRLPAGGALAVDRLPFSETITREISRHPHIEIVREEVAGLPPESWRSTILATGPLTSPPLAEAVRVLTGEESLSFFDAIAPIVNHDGIDFDICWMQSRYDKGDGADYVNCPMDRDTYEAFIAALLAGEKTDFKEWGDLHALFRRLSSDRGHGLARSRDFALRPDEAGRPVRSTQDRSSLRRRAAAPGQRARHVMEHGRLPDQAEAWRAGAHLSHDPRSPERNLRAARRPAPQHLHQFAAAARPTVAAEAAPIAALRGPGDGRRRLCRERRHRLLAGRFAAAEILGREAIAPPPTTALGALLGHITGDADAKTFQPMNVNFGLFPEPPPKTKGKDRKRAQSHRALADLESWLNPSKEAAE
ncbi:MAG: methylenetetrahydrofolate--tRNA-(uracil(54)-C(5))-methyltransferase (FADH(2)-oxidizing) TrmFO [Rhizomicrobium sp.]